MRILAICLLLTACAVTPESTNQRLIVADWSVTGAINAVADLKPVLSTEDYNAAATAVRTASTALSCAEHLNGIVVTVPGWNPAICPTLQVPNTTAGYLNLTNQLLLQASAYYAAKGE